MTRISSLAVISAEMNAAAAASTLSNGVALEKSKGTRKWRGPGQSVPKKYPGTSQGPAIRSVSIAAHRYGAQVERALIQALTISAAQMFGTADALKLPVLVC